MFLNSLQLCNKRQLLCGTDTAFYANKAQKQKSRLQQLCCKVTKSVPHLLQDKKNSVSEILYKVFLEKLNLTTIASKKKLLLIIECLALSPFKLILDVVTN